MTRPDAAVALSAKGAAISVIMIAVVMVASVYYVRSTRHEVRG